MQVHEAVAQINSIWDQVARTERFRGYRPATVAGTGFFGLAAAIIQPWCCQEPLADPDRYLMLWVTVACLSVMLVGLELLTSYLRTDSALERQLTKRAVQQFVPCLCSGAVVAWVLPNTVPESIVLLPGLWAICFSLGVFASLPFVTPAVVWIGLYYLVAGSLLLSWGRGELALHPWLMGGTFGMGQLIMSAVLWHSEERQDVTA